MANMVPHKAKNIIHIGAAPTFFITKEALYKIQCYVEECSEEIGWFGRILRDKDVFVCDEVFLAHQEVGPAATDITTEGLVELINEIGIDENETLRLWGHSHVNMGVNPSAEDNKTPMIFLNNGCEYFFRIICNKKGEIGVTFFNWAENYVVEDMEWSIFPEAQSDAVREAIKTEITEKVAQKRYSSTPSHYNDPEWEWDTDKRCYVYVGKKKEDSPESKDTPQTSLIDISTKRDSTKQTDTIQSTNNLFSMYLELHTWMIERMLSTPITGLDYLMENNFIRQIMAKYQISFRTMYEVVLKQNGREIEEESKGVDLTKSEAQAYTERCEDAFKKLEEHDKRAGRMLASFPKSMRKDPVVVKLCIEHGIDFEDLADVAFTKYAELIK